MALGAEQVEAIRRFCLSVSDESQTDLRFIRKYEKALKWVGALRKKASADTAFANNFLDLINSDTIAIDIDPSNELCDSLEKASRGLSEWIKWISEQHKQAQNSERLSDLVAELDETLERLYDLRPAFDQLREAIQKHDHDLNTTTGTYNSVREMFAALNAK